jgi:hypothetical protein
MHDPQTSKFIGLEYTYKNRVMQSSQQPLDKFRGTQYNDPRYITRKNNEILATQSDLFNQLQDSHNILASHINDPEIECLHNEIIDSLTNALQI